MEAERSKGFRNSSKGRNQVLRIECKCDVYAVSGCVGGCRIMLICEELWHYYTLPAVARVSTQHLLNTTQPQ